MIVRCLKILDVIKGEEIGYHPAIAVGDTLVVIEVGAIRGKEPRLRVVDPNQLPEDRLPGVWPASMFEVLDPSIPSNWEIHLNMVESTTYLSIAPASWQRPGFWEDLADGSELGARAIDEYDRELAILLREAKREGSR